MGNLKDGLEKLEKNISELEKTFICFKQDISEIYDKIAFLESIITLIQESIILSKYKEFSISEKVTSCPSVFTPITIQDKKPYKCPACEGNCLFNVEENLLFLCALCIKECHSCKESSERCDECKKILDSIREIQKCKACEGKGIIWG